MRIEVISQMTSMHSDEQYLLTLYEVTAKTLANYLRSLTPKIAPLRPMETRKCQNERKKNVDISLWPTRYRRHGSTSYTGVVPPSEAM